MAEQITSGSKVTLSYELALASGQVIESVLSDEPWELVVGQNELVEQLEERLLGLSAGEQATFRVAADEGVFGPYDGEKVKSVPRAEFPNDIPLTQHSVVSFDLPNGEQVLGTVLSEGEEVVEIDFNHPLVDHDFIFEVNILKVENNE